MGTGSQVDEDEEPYWPRVPGSSASHVSSGWRDQKPVFVPAVRPAEAEGSASEEERGGTEKVRWPSVVRSEYHERMEEMWRLCGERLGREIEGGRWWV